MNVLKGMVLFFSLSAFFSTLAMATDTKVDVSVSDYSILDQIVAENYLDQYTVLAKADTADATAEGAEGDKALSEECRSFANQPDADLGEVLKAGCEPSLEQMSKLMDNPVGNVAMLFTQFDYYRLKNDENNEDAYKGVYMGIAQFPKKLNKNWSLINRVIWTVPSVPLDQDKIDDAGGGDYGNMPGAITPPSDAAPINLFDGRTTGFGDMYYVGLFSPAEGIKFDNLEGNLVWGAGFDLGVPTASEDILGTGKWTAGPSALGIYLGPKWKVGGLLQHYWDYAGDDDRSDVNLSNLQTIYYYSLNETTSIGAAPNVIVNWEEDSDNRYTVPIGFGINRTFQMGKVPVRFGVEFHYAVIRPDDIPGTDWDLRFFMIPAAPSAMFDWMN